MGTEVVWQTLRERRRSLLWWGLGIVALVGINIAFYPSVRDSAGLSDYSKDLPEAMRALFAGGETNLISATGYLNSQVFALMAPLVLLIFAIGVGAASVAGEEERGTLDMLLAQPLERADFVLQRFLALLALVVALTAGLLATVAVGSWIVSLEIGFGKLVAASGSVGLLALLFGALALAVGAVRPGRGRAIAVAAGVAIAAWMLDGLGQAVNALEPWRPISPYYQALGTNPLHNGVPWGHWVLLIALTALVVATAIAGLRRRDLRQ
jgi:beta-exotoxin I transport system permease protein